MMSRAHIVHFTEHSLDLECSSENSEREREQEIDREIPTRLGNPAVMRHSKIRWNLAEKASAPEELPPQLVIRRFLLAFMRPFCCGIYWKDFPPRGTPSERVEERTREDLVPARASRSHARFFSSPPSAPPRCRTRSPRALSSSLIEYSPLYLRMPVEIYRRSRCSFRFNLLHRRLLFPFWCAHLDLLMLFPSLRSFFLPSRLRCPSATSYFYSGTQYAQK